MASLYGADAGGGEGRCPGEEACELFQSATGEVRCPEEVGCEVCSRNLDSRGHACLACPLKATKPAKRAGTAEADVAELVEHVEALAGERDSGRRLDLDELTPVEWWGLRQWDACVAHHERAYKARLSMVIEALLTRG